MTERNDNLYSLALELRIPERKVIDFSNPSNPLGVSKKIKAELRKHLKYLKNYPDPYFRRLKWHISRQFKIPEKYILCSNGSTELIHLLLRVFEPKKILILAPTNSEYEKAVNIKCSGSINFLYLREEDDFRLDINEFIEAMNECDMAFLCNPNSLTGYLVEKEELLKIALEAEKKNCLLVVDEAFIDYVPEYSVIKEVTKNPYLTVLRSLSSFYALGGLRVGFGIFNDEIIDNIREKKEPLTMNILSQRAGVVAIRDKVYKKQTQDYLLNEKLFIEESLKSNKIFYYSSKVNFYLLKDDNGKTIFKNLKAKGIFVKDCSTIRGLDERFLWMAVKTHKENILFFKNI